MSRYNIIFILGPPGAGKGTQCVKIAEKYNYFHLSAGGLLRAEINNPFSEYSVVIDKCFKKQMIVPVEITCTLLERDIKSSGKHNFLIDGFPISLNDYEGWCNQMKEKVNLQFILYLDCNLKLCTNRILARGAAGSGRADDNSESLKKRFDTYKNLTLPVINHFHDLGLVKKIDASNTPEEVFESVKKLFS